MKTLSLTVQFNAINRLVRPLKDIQNQFKKAGVDIDATKKQLRELDATQKQLTGFTKQQRTLSQTSEQLNKAQERVRVMRTQMRQGAEWTKKFGKEFERANKDVHALTQKLKTQRKTLGDQRKALEAAGVNVRKLSGSESKLKADADALNATLQRQKEHYKQLTQRQRELTQQQARAAAMQERLKKIHNAGMKVGAHGLGMAYGGMRAAQFLSGQLTEGMTFDSSMSKVQALARLDKNSPELAAIRQQARDLGASTMFSATDVAAGQTFLAMAGFTPKNIRAAMPGLLDMAKAGDVDLAQTADIASNILGGFGLEASQMGRVADALTKTFTTSNTTIQMLGESMKYVAPIANKAGVSLEQAAAMAGLLGNVGIQGSEAGTTLRAMLLRLSAPTSAAAKQLNALGLSVSDKNGNIRSMVDILEDLSWVMEGTDQAEQLKMIKDIFGERPASGVMELISQAGTGNLRNYMKTVADNAGEAAKTAKVMANNLEGDIDELTSAYSDIRIQIFESNNKEFRSFVQELTGYVNQIGKWIRANPEQVIFFTKLAAAIIAVSIAGGALLLTLGPALMIFSTFAKGLIFAAKALKIFGGAMIWLGKFLWAHPLIAIAAALALAGVFIYKNWDEISAYFKDLYAQAVSWSTDMMVGFVDGLTQGWVLLKDKVSDTAGNVADWFKEKLGIHSPSRVFMAFGVNTLEGYQKGLSKQTNPTLSHVRRIGQQVSAAGAGLVLAGSLQADSRHPISATSHGLQGGDTNYFNIYAAPGQDARDIAAEVERILNQRERRHAIRQGSKLRD